ncbi:TetR/AcrR family transcriptional regulator [Nocardioides mangrovicus]|uniref:TetR/AcrR family transcriptional regulator n=1 Tax=Nocardioides mangrovicus TaxID=2478913 RepID=UPI001314974B|nr:TetR/AcrR family transcriptional regulator [Nocardioides mangrovicus]
MTDARQRILTAAADCIVRDGLAGVRMAAIAREAGVSSGLLHYHFDTKEQLFAEVLTFSSHLSDELTVQALDRAGTHPAQRLAAFLDRCLPSDDRLRHDWLLWQEFEVLSLRQPELAKASLELYETLYTAVADIVFEGVEAGVFELPAREVRTTAEAVVALCDGIGERVLAPDDLSLADARERVAVAAGRLVGHHGPLPSPVRDGVYQLSQR